MWVNCPKMGLLIFFILCVVVLSFTIGCGSCAVRCVWNVVRENCARSMNQFIQTHTHIHSCRMQCVNTMNYIFVRRQTRPSISPIHKNAHFDSRFDATAASLPHRWQFSHVFAIFRRSNADTCTEIALTLCTRGSWSICRERKWMHMWETRTPRAKCNTRSFFSASAVLASQSIVVIWIGVLVIVFLMLFVYRNNAPLEKQYFFLSSI